MAHRYLWGPAVDQLLADEQVDSLTNASQNETLWALTDHLGSVRDAVDDAGTLRLHRTFDGFGNGVAAEHYNASGNVVTEGQGGYVTVAFAYTGKYFETSTGLQQNWHRWYDPRVGRWLSEDWIRDDVGNSYRYVGNAATSYVDVNGLQRKPVYAGGHNDNTSGFWEGINPFYWGDFSRGSDLDDQLLKRDQARVQKQLALNPNAGQCSLKNLQADRTRQAVDDARGFAATGVQFNAAAYGGTFLRPGGAGVGGSSDDLVENSRYLRDFQSKRTVQRSATFKSEGHARQLAREKLGKGPVCVGNNKWRSADGRWQYRAKPVDTNNKHVHLERLDPETGEVLENWHLYWPEGGER